MDRANHVSTQSLDAECASLQTALANGSTWAAQCRGTTRT